MILQRTIRLQGKDYPYEFERKRIRNLNLRIRNDGSIYVSAPMRVSDREVERFLVSKEQFILKSISKCRTRPEKRDPGVVSSGCTVRIFGQDKTVMLMTGRNKAEMIGDIIVVYAKDINDEVLVNKVYNKWRCDLLARKVLEFCSEVQPEFVKMGAKPPLKIRFRTMKSRWGSCIPAKGMITFSYNLSSAPEDCIRYVVIHEYAHLLVPNHSDRFYRYVAVLCPDWREKRRALNEC